MKASELPVPAHDHGARTIAPGRVRRFDLGRFHNDPLLGRHECADELRHRADSSQVTESPGGPVNDPDVL